MKILVTFLEKYWCTSHSFVITEHRGSVITIFVVTFFYIHTSASVTYLFRLIYGEFLNIFYYKTCFSSVCALCLFKLSLFMHNFLCLRVQGQDCFYCIHITSLQAYDFTLYEKCMQIEVYFFCETHGILLGGVGGKFFDSRYFYGFFISVLISILKHTGEYVLVVCMCSN